MMEKERARLAYWEAEAALLLRRPGSETLSGESPTDLAVSDRLRNLQRDLPGHLNTLHADDFTPRTYSHCTKLQFILRTQGQ